MKKVFKFSVLAVMISIAAMSLNSCKKSSLLDVGDAKLSPPSWIQGSWGGGTTEVFKFTSNDVFLYGTSLKSSWNGGTVGTGLRLKETKNSGTAYEITVTAKSMGIEMVSACYSFRKGDGTYLEFAQDESGKTLTDDDFGRLEKLN